jgi:hypothetical protein
MQLDAALNVSRYEFAEDIAREYISRLTSKNAFDIGASGDRIRGAILALGLNWYGFDLKPTSPDVRQWDLDERCPDTGASPGIVFMLDVIEHLYNPGLGIAHVAEIMKPGALLVITTPNPRWSRSRLHALMTGFLTCFTQNDLDGNHHVFTPWPHIIEHLLVSRGFSIERYVTIDGRYDWPEFSFSLRYPLRGIHAALNKFIEWRDPSACGMSYAVVARRI